MLRVCFTCARGSHPVLQNLVMLFNHFMSTCILYVDQINQMLLISYKGQFYYIHVHAVKDCFTIIVSDCKELQLLYLELHRCDTVHHRMQHITWLSSLNVYIYLLLQHKAVDPKYNGLNNVSITSYKSSVKLFR